MSTIYTKSYARTTKPMELPTLIDVQLRSFEQFTSEGLAELFDEISPIESFNGDLKLYFPSKRKEVEEFNLSYWFGEPKYNVEECVERDMSYAAPLYVRVMLYSTDLDQPIEQDIFMGDFPLMTSAGTFIINGTERVVVSQLIRSPGAYFEVEEERTTGRPLAMGKLIPDRGAWMEFETRKTDYLTVKFNRKRTVPVTLFLRAMAAIPDGLGKPLIKEGTDEELLSLFADVDTNGEHLYIQGSIEQEPHWDEEKPIPEQALIEFYKRMRPGDPPTLDNASQYLQEQLYDSRRYDLAAVGRYKLNKRLNLQNDVPLTHRTITQQDIVNFVRHMILINNGLEGPDDIDHLGNRRVKTVGELIQAKLRVGLRRMERVVRERMSIRENDNVTPVALINIRPVVAAIREFFGSSQLSQFMEQANPLAELTHKRTLSALGPGGLRRERAGFEVRDVHHSHYGRICPIETPEGPNIGLIGRLATYGRVNKYGFIETPYRRVMNKLPVGESLINHDVFANVTDPATGEIIVPQGETVTAELVKGLAAANITEVQVKPFLTDEVIYMSADEEDHYTIAQANAKIDERGQFAAARVSSRRNQQFRFTSVQRVDFMDVAPRQIVGVSAALIPFLEHDDANRALMGSNMQRQAVPLLQPDVPIVSTGMELQAALNSGQVVLADQPGEVVSVSGDKIVVIGENGPRVYGLRKYNRSNQSTCIDQHPVVYRGQRVQVGDILADSSSTHNGELALGQDVVVAFLSWEGGNFEDAILVSEAMVRKDRFTSIHIEKHEVEARDTKLGPEEITYDIPNVSEDALKDLDERGIIRVGADVNENDILVGKITPKGEKELSPEEKLLRAIFGDKAREVKDSSLRLPNGARGKVVDVQVFDRQHDRDLPAGVETMVRVSVAQRRKISEGDKMAGRHGNKGVISKIVPIEDMPYLDDGRSIDIILSPLGVPGRMNIGQVLETHLGWAAHRLGFRAITPVFDGATELEIAAELGRAWLIDHAWDIASEWSWDWLAEIKYDTSTLVDQDHARRMFIVAWLSDLGYDPMQLETDEAYARRAAAREWLRGREWNPDHIFPDDPQDVIKARWQGYDTVAIEACVREWYAAVLEKQGDLLPDMVKVDPATAELDQLIALSNEIAVHTHIPLPTMGKERLFDGKSGRPFDQPVTVGVLHMMKLAHLVEDKAHARSTGPYSLVTQQPLGGKAQFGGQRFGEMEVWALEAYGAAHTLQEMLTVKSDDTQGRVKTYEAIVKNEPIEEPGVPASFRVLVKELQSLGLAVEAVTEGGEVVRFGKEDDKRTSRKWAQDDFMSMARSNR
ncbi:DNA-directed RNA polymerase subunit beta [Candidatus Promineifilum breve]|uniref:DNA-directed RNA polymerase subunit beta n=1 Tax=Candidatus Promineifilum breve TaxID=1806508 RepID=A0A160T7J6_9CHLR|nr:DNA-directed RNA polymerase subunit beta [Candidatus Promineifilum breve]CUS05308.2 DNA-directed RNA polymerase subunit beta [Candidatus Promineifilum breve]